ncbi:hypothetical protein DY245_01560 [Streptomyces inhibens]|uniref:Uncharacterized protein n=1 Tax=Streptomyces inhibens TaxID=2293571 RepID=A0A371QBB3_STRIH|nr:hypothetical protein DY245_01560 [Streptomyces inhibens]
MLTCGVAGRPPAPDWELSPLLLPLLPLLLLLPSLPLLEVWLPSPGGLPATGSGEDDGCEAWGASEREGPSEKGELGWFADDWSGLGAAEWSGAGPASGVGAASGCGEGPGVGCVPIESGSECGRAESGVVSGVGRVLTGSGSGRAESGVLSGVGWVLTGSESGRAASGRAESGVLSGVG